MAEGGPSIGDVTNDCVRCKNPARVGLKCIRCGVTSHKSCLKLLKHVKYLDGDKIICCSDIDENSINVTTVTNPSSDITVYSEEAVVKIRHLEELIRHKDLLIKSQGITIKNQEITIRALNDQIAITKRVESFFESKKGPLIQAVGASAKQKLTTGSSKPERAVHTNKSPVPLSPSYSQVVDGKLCSTDHLEKSNNKHSIGVPADKNTRKFGFRGILVGSNSDATIYPLKAAPLTSVVRHYHATNFDKDVSDDALQDYLSTFAPNVRVEKLSSRYPERYASFKVSVPPDEAECILKCEIWPSRVKVNKFFPSKKSYNEEP